MSSSERSQHDNSMNGTSDRVDTAVEPATTQQPLTSPFSDHSPPLDNATPAASSQTIRQSPLSRWQDATKKVTAKGALRFGANSVSETPATQSYEDTANKNSPLSRSLLEPRPSSLSRISSSLRLSNLGKHMPDRSHASAFAETVRLAQQQQQTNRQSAAPVLKAVPSTKVGLAAVSWLQLHSVELCAF